MNTPLLRRLKKARMLAKIVQIDGIPVVYWDDDGTKVRELPFKCQGSRKEPYDGALYLNEKGAVIESRDSCPDHWEPAPDTNLAYVCFKNGSQRCKHDLAAEMKLRHTRIFGG